jgi:hypothetical protein
MPQGDRSDRPARARRWAFVGRLRPRALGWRSARAASERVREAVLEIQAAAREEPLEAAEGAVRLIERLEPALENVAGSRALGTAVRRALAELIPLIQAAPADLRTRSAWLARLWEAYCASYLGLLEPLGERWGELCAEPELASQYADLLVPLLAEHLEAESDDSLALEHVAEPCLSALLAADRPHAVLSLLARAPSAAWQLRRHGVRALFALAGPGAAVDYAESSRSPRFPEHDETIDRTCESILLAAGRTSDAWHRYALPHARRHPGLATFRRLAATYPGDERTLLVELIAAAPSHAAPWFSTASHLGHVDLALELVQRLPCEPRAVVRSGRDHLATHPHVSLAFALASLRWLASGHGPSVTPLDIQRTHSLALTAARRLALLAPVRAEIRAIVASASDGGFVRESLRRRG